MLAKGLSTCLKLGGWGGGRWVLRQWVGGTKWEPAATQWWRKPTFYAHTQGPVAALDQTSLCQRRFWQFWRHLCTPCYCLWQIFPTYTCSAYRFLKRLDWKNQGEKCGEFSILRDSDGEGETSASGGCSMLTAATGDRAKNAKKDSNSAKRNYRKRRGGGGGSGGPFLGKGGTTETQTSVISSSAYESVDPGGENGEVVYCSLQASRLVQIDLTHMDIGEALLQW